MLAEVALEGDTELAQEVEAQADLELITMMLEEIFLLNHRLQHLFLLLQFQQVQDPIQYQLEVEALELITITMETLEEHHQDSVLLQPVAAEVDLITDLSEPMDNLEDLAAEVEEAQMLAHLEVETLLQQVHHKEIMGVVVEVHLEH